jgi:predicted metalloendopeptidase
MDVETKEKAKLKAQRMIGNLAFPKFLVNENGYLKSLFNDVNLKSNNFLSNLYSLVKNRRFLNLREIKKEVNRTLWKFPPTDVNARYYKEINKIVIPAGILKPPYYSWNGPMSVNFGGIGSVMGHEMTHGFDSAGRKFDGDGNIINWWSNKSENSFLKKTKCFVEQYDKYEIDGKETLNENLADNGGINVAFRAYSNWKIKHGEEERLPGVNFTDNQLFFIANSQIWCTKYRSFLPPGQHSPGPVRVRGMASNSLEFAQAFNCKPNSRMNPFPKCSIW